MPAIFISHRSTDAADAQALKDWLAAQGHERVFLDFDPADGIPAGVDWEQHLYRALRRCQALMVVLTPAWLESTWCSNELAIAREKGKPVFVVRTKPVRPGPLLPSVQEVDLTTDRDAGLQRLAHGLRDFGLDPRRSFDWKSDRPIYPGLPAFDVDDAAIFFGRSAQSWQAAESLRHLRMQARGAPKLLLITGASGSGKSSMMRAGLLAQLRKEPAQWIVARPLRVGANGALALAEAIAWAFPPDRRPADLDALARRLAGPTAAAGLLACVRELRFALDRPDATLVVAIDQAEELLARTAGAELLNLLRDALAESDNELVTVATLRSDQLGAWQQHPSVKATADHPELLFETFPLGPMPMTQVGEIVRGPAAYVELQIDDALVDALQRETATPDALPLLAYTLRTLYERHGSGGHLTLEHYRAIGGIEGAVRNQADAALRLDTLPQDARDALRDAFVPGLVRAAADGAVSRSRAFWDALPPLAHPHLRRLVDARLLVIDTDRDGRETVEIAHEALLRTWPMLERWIWDDADALRQLEAIQRAARDYHASGERADYVVHLNQRLAAAQALTTQPRFASSLGPSETAYLEACAALQRRRNAQQARRLRFALAGAAVLLLALGAGGFFALTRMQETTARLLDEAAAVYRTGDLAGALVPIERITGYPSIAQPRAVGLLREFWTDGMTPLPRFLADAGRLAVIEINGRRAVTLSDGSPHVPEVVGRPLIRYDPMLRAFIVADTRTLSLRTADTFAPVLALDVAAVSKTEARRMTPTDILAIDRLGMAVAHMRTLETTNDEDNPEEWHASLTFFFRTAVATPRDVCTTATPDGTPAPCEDGSVVMAQGIAAVVLQIADGASIEAVTSAEGPALAIRSSHRTECDILDDNCKEQTIEDLVTARMTDGRLTVTTAVDPRTVMPDAVGPPTSTAAQPVPAFPLVRPPARHWRLATAPAAPAAAAPMRPPLDFSRIQDSERYAEIYDTYEPRLVDDGANRVFWAATPGGNSWVMYSGCRFDAKNVVITCADLQMSALNAYSLASPDNRFLVQRNCNGFEASLQALDMRTLARVTVAAPADFIVGFAITPRSDTLAALTEQNEILVYSIDGNGQMSRTRQVSLPREPGAIGEAACEEAHPMAFVNDTLAIGLSMGGKLFAVDTARGEIRWFGTRADQEPKATAIAASPDGRLVAVHDGRTVQLVSSETGLPLTERMALDTLLKATVDPTDSIVETLDVTATGEIRARCPSYSTACKDQMFVRDPPALDATPGCRFELRTGRDVSGGRLDPAALLALPRDACMSPR